MISLRKVSKSFDVNWVIEGLSIEITRGEVVGFLGPNGAGKTTTVRMIAGVLPPTEGVIKIDGVNLFAEGESYRPHIGYLPENNPLYDDMTVEEFLSMWADLKNVKAEEKEAVIHDAVASIGLVDVYYRPISELSKGYKQRVGLAQAILSSPEILLLDEPTEGLDPNQRAEIHKLIKGLGKDRTVIICSHVLPEITKMCDRVLIIKKGKIVGDSPIEEFHKLSKQGLVYELVAHGKKIEESLKTLSGIESISSEKVTEGEKFVMKSHSEKDLRLPIFKMAKENGWDLYELTRKQHDLEDVFAELTKE